MFKIFDRRNFFKINFLKMIIFLVLRQNEIEDFVLFFFFEVIIFVFKRN